MSPYNSRTLALFLILALSPWLGATLSAMTNPGELCQRLEEEHKRKLVAGMRSWLAANNVEPIPLPKMSNDPKESERARAQEIERANGVLVNMANIKRSNMDATPENDFAIYQMFKSMKSDDLYFSFVLKYGKR